MSSCLNTIVSRVDGIETPKITIGRKPIVVRCGVVCSINSDFYLKIPTENIWLIPDNDFSQDIVIYSNVSWIIE